MGTKEFAAPIWMRLGEAASKANHIAGVPLDPEVAHSMLQLFLAKGALATTAIEGNTLTEAQAVAQVKGELKLPPSQQYLQQEMANIIDACNWICKELGSDNKHVIDVKFCCLLNEMVLSKLEVDEGVVPGEIRHHNVVVGNVYRGAPAEDCFFLMERMCEVIEETDATGEYRHQTAILIALFAHVYMALIHPFGDGNGRTARLLEFYILMRCGFAMPTGHLLSNHYNKTRNVYYRELDRVSKSGGALSSFVNYALEGFVDGLKEQIALIRQEQMRVTWEHYVHSQFHDKKTAADHRRRDLVLALGERDEWIKLTDLPMLNTTLAVEYAAKTEKTISRDLNVLQEMQLIRKAPRRVRANQQRIKAWLPWSALGNGDA
ncbi:Fic family protein [Pararhizobium sp.]|uniref:Fic family protein n=1 Tax=Pararhizobium sp. TaxID=1977563 RepID=UPI00271E5056|nr:Fic family protein [Pararhizobium sp.]MDO9416214.1 Fic family protein [Pararhizobium sp.]